ncbi:MAG: PfkB family carbohydrate kinase, partial [Conexivisphaerales archaeon]
MSDDISSYKEKVSKIKIAVIGDSTIDRYTVASAKRISPEAPIPALNVDKEYYRIGASFNAVESILNLGAKVAYFTVTGSDLEGQQFARELERNNVATHWVFPEKEMKTTSIHRVISDGYLMLWMEKSRVNKISKNTERMIIEKLDVEDVNAIVLSDHGRGTITEGLLKGISAKAKTRNIPVLINGRGGSVNNYNGVDYIRISREDSFKATGITLINDTSYRNTAIKIASLTGAKGVVITWLEDGFYIINGKKFTHIAPLHVRPVNLVGIGDTITSIIALFMSAGLSLEESSRIAYYGGVLASISTRRSPQSFDKLAKF